MADNMVSLVKRRNRKRLPEDVIKQRKLLRCKKYDGQHVQLGCEYGRWQAIKADKGLKKDSHVATFLIDFYYRHAEANMHYDSLSCQTTVEQLSIPTSAGSTLDQSPSSTSRSVKSQMKKADDCIVMKQEYVGETFEMTSSNENSSTDTRTENCVTNPQKQVTGQNSMNTSSLNNIVNDNVKVDVDLDNIKVDIINDKRPSYDETKNTTTNNKDAVATINNDNNSSSSSNTTACTDDSAKTATHNNDSAITATHNDDSAKNDDSDKVDMSGGDDLEDDELVIINRIMVDNNRDKVVPVVNKNHGNNKFSSRIRSRGFRPNYAALDWTESSVSDKSGSNNDDDADEIVDDDDCKDEMECSDEDYIPPDDNKKYNSKKNSVKDQKGKIKKNSDRYKKDKVKKNSDEGKQDIAEKKIKTIKKLPEKTNWKSIKLEDHKEKFCTVDLESFERQHRANRRVVTKAYKCLVCQRFKCPDVKAIHNHLEEHVNKVLECSKCDFIAAYPMELKTHQRKAGHMKNVTYVCEICGLAFSCRFRRNFHSGNVHNIPMLKCRLCPEKFARVKTRYQHMRDAHPDQCQYCETCKKCFINSAFVEHAKLCQSNVVCEQCGKDMKYQQLPQHTATHHKGIRTHQCMLCDYSAKSNWYLKRHMLTHNKSHPFHCDKCTFSCNQSTQLKSHMRTHSGEKPFKCTQCNYAASWKVQLKDHVKVHVMPEAVKCDHCDIVFKNMRSLDIHRKKQH